MLLVTELAVTGIVEAAAGLGFAISVTVQLVIGAEVVDIYVLQPAADIAWFIPA